MSESKLEESEVEAIVKGSAVYDHVFEQGELSDREVQNKGRLDQEGRSRLSNYLNVDGA